MPEINFHSCDLKFKNQVNNTLIDYQFSSNVKVKTSGSTGTPKSIEIEKSYIKNSCKGTFDYFKLPNNPTILLCLAPSYIAGKMMIYRSIEWNAQLHCILPNADFKILENKKIHFDFVAMVPLQIEKIVQLNPEILTFFDTILLGGAPISNHLETEILKYHQSVYHSFGMTETVSHFAIRKLGNTEYKALNKVTFEIDELSQLIVKAPNLTKYKQLKTHDIVDLRSSTSFVWKGRSDFTINSGGHKIHPEKVEIIINHLFQKKFILSSIPDVTFGEKLILIHEENINEISILKEIKKLVHQYEVPKTFFKVDALKLTHTGKINRLKTREAIINV